MKTILVSAHAYHPNRGSEPYVAWNWVKQASKNYKIIVITSYSAEKEKLFTKINLNNVEIILVKHLFDYNWLKKRICGKILSWIFYYEWQVRIYYRAKKIIKDNKIDIVHHLTYNSFSIPSFLIYLKKPFIWGPLGGAEEVPRFLYKYLGFKGTIFEVIRKTYLSFSYHAPMTKYLLSNSKMVIAANTTTQRNLNLGNTHKIKVCLETAIEDRLFLPNTGVINKHEQPISLLYVGDLIPLKGLRFLFIVLEKIPKDIKWELNLVGDGNEIKYLDKYAKTSNIRENICFHGRVPKEKVYNYYSVSDIFVFPSFRDTSGNVLLEAMTYQLPIICFDNAGPGDIVDKNCGIKIPLTNNMIVKTFTDAIVQLCIDKDLRTKMGKAGLNRVRNKYTWVEKYNEILEIYG